MSETGWRRFLKLPIYNLDTARYITIYFIGASIIVLTASESPLDYLIAAYYNLPIEFSKQALSHLGSQCLTFGCIAGISWGLMMLADALPWKKARTVLHVLNFIPYYIGLFGFVVSLTIIFSLATVSTDQDCAHPNLPNCTGEAKIAAASALAGTP